MSLGRSQRWTTLPGRAFSLSLVGETEAKTTQECVCGYLSEWVEVVRSKIRRGAKGQSSSVSSLPSNYASVCVCCFGSNNRGLVYKMSQIKAEVNRAQQVVDQLLLQVELIWNRKDII